MKLSTKEQTRLKTNYGPWAFVAGSSSGIGLELAKTLASSGFHVVIHGRQQEKLELLAKEWKTAFGVEVVSILADLATDEGIQKVISQTQSLPIGLFIMSAGYGTSGSFLTNSIHAEANMLKINCESLLVLTHYFAQRFVAQKHGGIILLSSMVAFQGVPFAANYSASKAYVQSLAEALQVELKPFGVDVLAAAPGPVKSGFSQRANMEMGMALSPEDVAVPILKALGRQQTVLPGFLTKFLVYSLMTLPRWGKVQAMKLVMGGMTAHQRN